MPLLPLHIAALMLAAQFLPAAPRARRGIQTEGETSSPATPMSHWVCWGRSILFAHLPLSAASLVARLSGSDVAGLATALTEEPGSFPADYQPSDSWPQSLTEAMGDGTRLQARYEACLKGGCSYNHKQGFTLCNEGFAESGLFA